VNADAGRLDAEFDEMLLHLRGAALGQCHVEFAAAPRVRVAFEDDPQLVVGLRLVGEAAQRIQETRFDAFALEVEKHAQGRYALGIDRSLLRRYRCLAWWRGGLLRRRQRRLRRRS